MDKIPTIPVHQKMNRPLRSGNEYQKDNQKSKASEGSQKTLDSSWVPNRLDTKSMDLPWDSIRRSQESDDTLQRIFELLQDPDAPTEVNQFGMGVVHLWNQRKSMVILNGVIHRNYETAKDSSCINKSKFPLPYEKNFCIGFMETQHLDISGCKRPPTNCNDMPTGQDGERTWNCSSDAVANVVGTARDPHVLRDS